MGLSGSSSTSNTNQTQNTNQTENATTTPVTPDFLTQAATDYVGRIGAFGQMDPNSFVAPSSPLQNMAWQNASSLGDWRGQAATASQQALSAGTTKPNYAGVQPQMGASQMSSKFSGDPQHTSELALPTDPAQRGSPPNAFSGASSQGPAYTYQAPSVGSLAGPSAYGASQTSLGNAPLVSGAGYTAPQVGNAQGYAAARIGSPIGAQASNAGAGNIAGNISQFQNPYQQQVVNSSLADFDHNAAVQQGQLEAQGAAAGAFGGSRFGVAQSNLLSDQGRSRATLDSGLLSQGFDTAANLAGQQAGYDQNTNVFNAQNATQNSQFNSGQGLQAQMAQAGLDSTANQYGAEAGNQFSLANQQAQQQAGQFNAGNQQQAGLANQAAQSQYGLAQFGANTQDAQNFAQAQNQAGLTGYQGQLAQSQLQAQLAAQAGQYNAGANNQMSQFNATQGDNALTRQLQSAGMLGGLANDYGAGTRADLATMGQLGDQQRSIEQSYAMAGPAQLQLMGQLSGMTPYDILVGRNVNGTTNGTMTGTGTQTTTQNPSLFSNLLGAASVAGSFF